MPADDFEPKLGRIRDRKDRRNLRTTRRVLEQAAKAGVGAGHRGRARSSRPRGTAPGALARAGLIAPVSRRVVVRARYVRQRAGHLGAAKAHIRYIERDGVTADGGPGRLYDARSDEAHGSAFVERSASDPHQFRFIVSPEDGARLGDLKPFVRDLMAQMEQDLATKLDWVAVDHFNTGHPHTHIVIRGRDDRARDLVMARSYVSHGVRARAQALVMLELGPESELERRQKLFNEIEQDRFTRLDRALLASARDNIVVIASAETPARIVLRIGRLRKLERLGLAAERRPGVWALDAGLETKLRRMGERADTYKLMQRALKDARIERSPGQLAVFERGERRRPVTGKLLSVGLVDEITDRCYAIVDGSDGRVHYAEIGRVAPDDMPGPGAIVVLTGRAQRSRDSAALRLDVLSRAPLERLAAYNGPTCLEPMLAAPDPPGIAEAGFGAEFTRALAARRQWLVAQRLAHIGAEGQTVLKPETTVVLRERERIALGQTLSRQLGAAYLPHETGAQVAGTYERAVATPTGKLAVIRREDTFTLAPWAPALKALRGRAVVGRVGPDRASWALDRGRALPGRA